MQPRVHAQPRVSVIVIDVKCYNIIQLQHVKCKQNGRWAKYCAFVLESMERRKPASSLVWHFPSWCIHLCSFYKRLSECEFVSCSCHPLCLHSLQLEDMLQFLAIQAFFFVHDFSWSWIFSSPHFSSNRMVSLCSQTLLGVVVSVAILNVFYYTRLLTYLARQIC